MTRTIIIEGNSVYEVDENCMLRKRRKSAEAQKQNENRCEDTGEKKFEE